MTSYSEPFVGSSAVTDYTRATQACRDRLTAAGVDLAAYNAAESAADLEVLRRALGYRQWNLFALSADVVLGLTYMRLFPDRIRSAIVDSGQSPQHLWGLDHYRGLNETAGAGSSPAVPLTPPATPPAPTCAGSSSTSSVGSKPIRP